MRKVIFAAVAVIPTLIHAQAISPAQPESRTSTVLVARFDNRETPAINSPRASGVPYKPAARVSTGIVPPQLIQTIPVAESADWDWKPAEAARTAVVKVLVGKDGIPTDVRMLKGLGGRMDDDVVASVSRFTFQPGKLNDKAFPMEVELTVHIHSQAK